MDLNELSNKILEILNRDAQTIVSVNSMSSPRSIGDAVQEFLAKIPTISFIEILGQREGIAVKPDPTIVFDILKKAEVQPEEVLYVGDSGVDMQTAINSGVDAVGVAWGFRPKAELESFCPKGIIDKAEELLEFV